MPPSAVSGLRRLVRGDCGSGIIRDQGDGLPAGAALPLPGQQVGREPAQQHDCATSGDQVNCGLLAEARRANRSSRACAVACHPESQGLRRPLGHFYEHRGSLEVLAARPKLFGKPLETLQVVKYVQFMEGTVLKCLVKQWLRVYAAAAKAAGSLIAGSQPDSAEAADPSDELFKFCQAISAAEELLSAASSARSWVPSLSGLQALWKLLQLAAA